MTEPPTKRAKHTDDSTVRDRHTSQPRDDDHKPSIRDRDRSGRQDRKGKALDTKEEPNGHRARDSRRDEHRSHRSRSREHHRRERSRSKDGRRGGRPRDDRRDGRGTRDEGRLRERDRRDQKGGRNLERSRSRGERRPRRGKGRNRIHHAQAQVDSFQSRRTASPPFRTPSKPHSLAISDTQPYLHSQDTFSYPFTSSQTSRP